MDSVTKFAHKLSGVSFPHFSLSSAGGLINSTDRIDVGAAGRGLGGCGVAGRAPTAGVAHGESRGGVLAAER